MINRYFYKSSISDFLNTPVDTIFGIMSRADEMDTAATQKYAWEHLLSNMELIALVLSISISSFITAFLLT